MIGSFWRNLSLIRQLVRREVALRYRGSLVGLAWSLVNPLLMLLVYTFVFTEVFKARWGGVSEGGKADFAVILFVGLIAHGLLAESLSRAPTLVLSHANYVKKVVFPLEILPWVSLGSTLFHTIVSIVALLLVQFAVAQRMPWTAVLVPVVFAPLVLASLGFSWGLASLGVYVRDIAQMTPIVTTVLMFLAPVFYPTSALPPRYQRWLLLNPLTFVIEEARKVLVWGELPNWAGLLMYFVISTAVAWAGFWWFQRTRRGFADVL